MLERIYLVVGVSTHSRAEAAAKAFDARKKADAVSTHSRAEAAALGSAITMLAQDCSFNTQPRGGGCFLYPDDSDKNGEFQHTAARRRLLPI